ncbi:MAG: hypothetical protein M1836_001715 [Candelina mexicana]|nr:MAG: hypothetical protein M1836_001715 [Candelina mexicana]
MDQSGNVNLDPGNLALFRGFLGEIPIDPRCRENSSHSEMNPMPHAQRNRPRLQISVTVEVPAVSNLKERVGEPDAANDADDEGTSENDNDANDDEEEAQENDGDEEEGHNDSQVNNSGDDGDDGENEDTDEEDDGNTDGDEEASSDSSSIIGGPDGRLMCDDEDSSDEDYTSDSSPIIGGPDGRLMCDDTDSSDENYSSDSSSIIGGPDGRLMCDDTDSSDESKDDPSSDEDLNFDGSRSEQVGTGSGSTEGCGVVGLPENSHDIENSTLPVIEEGPTDDPSRPRLQDQFRRILPAEDVQRLRNLAVAMRERQFMNLIGLVVGTVFGAARRRG